MPPSVSKFPNPAELAAQLTGNGVPGVTEEGFAPHGSEETMAPFGPESGIPASLDELTENVTRSYDLTVSSALDLKIPVAGSVEGGFNRRVVVLERAAFKRSMEVDVERQYGYAIRLCMTVNKWSADTKASLPFLAASAELGTITAQ